ncbi:MAG: phenylalanine--tRNA ligase subunit beta [Candidatus Saccharimonadales bacterium]
MKISINNAQLVSNVDLKQYSHEQLVTKIGAQLGEVDETVDWAPKYEGIVVARVVSCEDHPNADKLHVCFVDDGGVVKDVERNNDGHVQVVCGAPNVREGLVVAWIPPGATVPTTYGTDEPFVLSPKELRGIISNGMLASAAELGLSDNHDGLLEIEQDEITPGQPFVELYGLNDYVIDVENKMFTHRPDCFGVLGVARELAGINQQTFVSPRWYLESPTFAEATGLDLKVSVDIPDLCPRFMAVAIKDVMVKPSPIWLQSALTRVGIRPINNIVDATNWIMYVTAQPTHAYDYDKVAARSQNGAEIVVRHPKDGEQIRLLNDKIISPRAESIVIATGKELIGLAGVMGGADTEVDNSTKNIILEVASFDMYSIRRTSMHHGLFTDAVTRFNKGQSVHQNDKVLARLLEDILGVAGGEQASPVIDVKSELAVNNTLQIEPSFINERLGLDLAIGDMAALLRNVEFEVGIDSDKLDVKAPFWRTDIAIAEDIVEEIGRLYGYDQLPLELPSRPSEPTIRDTMLSLKSEVRQILKSAGANEVLTYSFVHDELLKKVGQDSANAYELSNALSPNLQFYRLSLTPSLLEKVHPNLKAGFEEFSIFELGKSHENTELDSEGVPFEESRLAFVYAANARVTPKDAGAAYFKAVAYIDYLMKQLGVDYSLIPTSELVAPYSPERSAAVVLDDGTQIGIVGEFTLSAITSLKLPKRCAGFELNTEALLQGIRKESRYLALSRFPRVSQDISLKVSSQVSYQALKSELATSLNDHKDESTTIDIEPIDIYQNEDSTAKHITFRVTVANFDRTLTAEEVNTLLDTAAADLQKSVSAERL